MTTSGAQKNGAHCKVVKLSRFSRLYVISWKVPPVLQPTIAAIVRGNAIQARQKTFQTGEGLTTRAGWAGPLGSLASRHHEATFPENFDDPKWIFIPLVQTERAWAFGVPSSKPNSNFLATRLCCSQISIRSCCSQKVQLKADNAAAAE